MRHPSAHKLALMAMLLALAVALGWADYYIPFPFVPGAKLGLANIVILIVLYELGIWEAAVVDLGRVFIVSLITGRFAQMGFFMSLGGAVFSFAIMVLLKFTARKMTIIGVSSCASLAHGFAQVFIYCLFVGNWTAYYYYPLMSLIGIGTGILIGILADRVMATKVIERQKRQYGFNLKKEKSAPEEREKAKASLTSSSPEDKANQDEKGHQA
jgi:heptaprenyl diphosphate synthase